MISHQFIIHLYFNQFGLNHTNKTEKKTYCNYIIHYTLLDKSRGNALAKNWSLIFFNYDKEDRIELTDCLTGVRIET